MADSHIAMVSSAKSRSVNASISFGIEEAILRSPARGEGSISDRAATEQESSGRISLHERAQAIDRRIPLIGNPVETDPDVGEPLRFQLPATLTAETLAAQQTALLQYVQVLGDRLPRNGSALRQLREDRKSTEARLEGNECGCTLDSGW